MAAYTEQEVTVLRAKSYGRFARPVIRMAAVIAEQLRRNAEAYAEECESWARQGYRPHYCPHGMDLWVDWDPICQWCEDSMSIHEEALWRARDIDSEVADRERVYLDFIDVAAQDRSEAADDLRYDYAKWVLAPYDEVMSRKRTRKVVLP